MRHRQTVKLVPPTLLLLVVWLLAGVAELHSQTPNAARTETVVTYRTEDGMTIFGTLHLPTGVTQPVPGIILFAEPGWIVRTTLEAPGRTLAEKYHMAALTVDHRGNGNCLSEADSNKEGPVSASAQRRRPGFAGWSWPGIPRRVDMPRQQASTAVPVRHRH
jgi:hypothetical protein